MTAKFIGQLRLTLQRFEDTILSIIFRNVEPGLCIAGVNHEFELKSKEKFSLKDLVGNGFLWGVPKTRRTVEKRLNRKFGNPDYVWKPLVPKTDLIMCVTCGSTHEASTLCGHCYNRVMKETEEMQEAITKQLGLGPVDSEVVVLYEGEKTDSEFWKGKSIVEMPKKRPEWFHQNLMQKTTQKPSEGTEIAKPGELA